MKKLVLSMAAAACLVGAMLTTAGAADVAVSGDLTLTGSISDQNYIIESGTDVTITVQGAVTMDGTGDAFTINADTTLEFAEGASLTLTGYDNGFVVENATLSGGGWVINDGDGMDLFRLKNSGKLNITGNVDLNGKDKTETTVSRAIVLPGSSSEQEVTLAANTTLSANNFYRGVETGGASGYTISGTDMNTSVFDFSDNDCGMFISYFDSNVHFDDCKLEVSNCTTSGIFMRQDNASLNGLYIDHVFINCVNDIGLDQEDIAIRFHTVQFAITNSVINIENAWNTGLWICDGWDKGQTKEISDTIINVKHVENNSDITSLFYSPVARRKAITLVPYGEWTIDGCTIAIDGASSASSGKSNEMEGGINIASDIHISHTNLFAPSTWTATPGMHGGKIVLKNSEITTSGIIGADIGTQIGQWLDIGENVVIDNGRADNHYTALCDSVNNGLPIEYFGTTYCIQYVVDGMSTENQADNRIRVLGGSFWSTPDEDVGFAGTDIPLYEESIPVNAVGDKLTMFEITQDAYEEYVTNDVITLQTAAGESYSYSAKNCGNDTSRFIWAPAVSVTFGENGPVVLVPKGTAFGLAGEMPEGTWSYNEVSFDESTVVTSDITVTLVSE